MVIPFWIQISETGVKTPIFIFRYVDNTIGQAYEAAGWAFPTVTGDCKSFTIHDQGWEIFRCNLFPPFANMQIIKSKYSNYQPADEDWVRDADSGWNRGVDVEMYAALMRINIKRWNKCFDRDMHIWFNREKSSL